MGTAGQWINNRSPHWPWLAKGNCLCSPTFHLSPCPGLTIWPQPPQLYPQVSSYFTNPELPLRAWTQRRNAKCPWNPYEWTRLQSCPPWCLRDATELSCLSEEPESMQSTTLFSLWHVRAREIYCFCNRSRISTTRKSVFSWEKNWSKKSSSSVQLCH